MVWKWWWRLFHMYCWTISNKYWVVGLYQLPRKLIIDFSKYIYINLQVPWSISSCTWNLASSRLNTECRQCIQGQYRSNPESTVCGNCTPNSNSPVESISITACVCNSGWTGLSGSLCTACAIGKYTNSGGSAACAACPANTNSLSGTTNLSDCIPNHGFGGDIGGPNTCRVCFGGITNPNTVICIECVAEDMLGVLWHQEKHHFLGPSSKV